MARTEPEPLTDPAPRCARCSDVIGVYEPLVQVDGDMARRTSRAAEPTIAAKAGPFYHLDCYESDLARLDTQARARDDSG
ncbi:MAG: hypothetical protein JO342_08915 [Solirubrobacterales bacterium]|nr:hypothetical protein [Solirubrobacterales bacterium]